MEMTTGIYCHCHLPSAALLEQQPAFPSGSASPSLEGPSVTVPMSQSTKQTLASELQLAVAHINTTWVQLAQPLLLRSPALSEFRPFLNPICLLFLPFLEFPLCLQ